MGVYANQIKARAKSLQVSRLIKALGQDEAIRILQEIDNKCPRATKVINKQPLTKDENEMFTKVLKCTSWKEIAKILGQNKSCSNSYTAVCRLALRYIANL